MTSDQVEALRKQLTSLADEVSEIKDSVSSIDARLTVGNERFAKHDARITALESRDVLDQLVERLWEEVTDRRTLIKAATFIATVVGLVNGLIVLLGRLL